MSILLWIMSHQLTLIALFVTFFGGVLYGEWCEFSNNDKKDQQRGHAEGLKD
ncbi:hypothetical protein [Lacticaseibacillus jixiensis]|uniref:hypothetical protein n=1 Tax=Lacticaseibacillus jixiensis TaxID=3231926 RepID=UPI0036F29E67